MLLRVQTNNDGKTKIIEEVVAEEVPRVGDILEFNYHPDYDIHLYRVVDIVRQLWMEGTQWRMRGGANGLVIVVVTAIR